MTLIDRIVVGLKKPHDEQAEDGDYILNPMARDTLRSQILRDAAVLIAIIDHEHAPTVVLTKRSANLRKHTGQIAFPGGAIDPTDANAVAAALREAEEEIGLARHLPKVLGELPYYVSGSGFRIKPIVALLDVGQRFEINTDEVEEVFEVPLAFLMDPKNHVQSSREWQGVERFYYEMPYEKHRIWGVTAGMIRAFYERVLA